MRETRNVEFKTDVSPSYLKTVSAFANGSGGIVVFGALDDGSRMGIDNPVKTALDIENQINDAISPRPSYSIDIDDENACVVLRIQGGTDKPYLYKSRAYVRRDSSSVPADQVELRRLSIEGSNTTFDALPLRGQTFSFSVLEQKLTNALSIESLSDDALKTLGLMLPDGSYTNAGAILADANDFTGLDIARFGPSISKILDRERVDGASALTQYDTAEAYFDRYYAYEEVRGMTRERRDSLPRPAFREAVANALVHRMWDTNARVRIEMFNDRIEVVSPGGLPRDLSEEEYLAGEISIPRNPLIANVFFRLGIIENFGTGVRRIREAYEGSGYEPTFRVHENSIAVILPTTDYVYEPSPEQAAVLEAMPAEATISSAQIALGAGFGKDKVLKLLSQLIDAGVVKKVGAGRGVRYRKVNCQ